jgi:hypothetical protein
VDFKEANKLPPELRAGLYEDMGPAGIAALKPVPANAPYTPYTQAGASQLQGQYYDPNMGDTTYGSTYGDKSGNSIVTLNPKDSSPQITRAHEMEHVLADQGLGSGTKLNSMWDKLSTADGGAYRGEVVKRLVEHAPYLQKNWGLDSSSVESGYFSPTVLQRPDKNNFLYEQMATLSALEQANNKRLTDDPYVRKNIFTTKGERETYNALTGLRQSRLDAKDLPPYTRQDDNTDPSAFQKLKAMLGFADGGVVPNAGNTKLI